MKIGKTLKELRISRNLTQSQLAEYLKIDRSNYSKYELDKLEINLDMLVALAVFYNVSTDYILGLTEI